MPLPSLLVEQKDFFPGLCTEEGDHALEPYPLSTLFLLYNLPLQLIYLTPQSILTQGRQYDDPIMHPERPIPSPTHMSPSRSSATDPAPRWTRRGLQRLLVASP
jgi:hypothetical protein